VVRIFMGSHRSAWQIFLRSGIQDQSGSARFRRFSPEFILGVCLLVATAAQAQSDAAHAPVRALHAPGSHLSSDLVLRELNASLQAVVAKTSAAVVQVTVAGYGPEEGHGHANAARIIRQHAIGSGIIVDPNGYILTNAHVVRGAQRIRVILPPPPVDSPLDFQPIHATQILEAKLIGQHKDSDIALLKVEAKNLPSLPLRSDVPVHQGELVFAIGSPEGLQDSVTMGVISAVTRQVDPDDPMVYIQTDAAVNPGNSGGPLVDIDGNVVGMNTMMLSSGGGNEGLGFAIPAAIVNFDYQRLREFGRVQHVTIGVSAQDITPTLAAGLGLARSWGTIISDVTPDGPADAAGLKPEDIVLTVDNRPIRGFPDFVAALYLHSPTKVLGIEVLRGAKQMSFSMPVLLHHDGLSELADVPLDQQSVIFRLGVLVTDLDEGVAHLLRRTQGESGVVVLGQTVGSNGTASGLQVGDVIRAVNRTPLESVSQLRSMVHDLKSGDPVALQVERDGKLQYLAFEIE
jgi:serine protease Do